MTALPANLLNNPSLARWITIEPDETITIRTGKVELGQGILTAMTAIAAAELGVPSERVRVGATETAIAPDEALTSSSASVEMGGAALRVASAMVREIARGMAAERLGCTAADLVVTEGRFATLGANDGVTYWQLRETLDLDRSACDLPLPRLNGGSADPSGQLRIDLPRKLAGAGFIHDIRLPRMGYGRVLRPAHPMDALIAVDRTAALALSGVLAVVVDGGFCGVVAEHDEQAVAAVETLRATARWQRQAEMPAFGIGNGWMSGESARTTVVLSDDGVASPAVVRHAASFSRPYIAHASIASSCAIATWTAGRLSLVSHSQGIHPLRRQLAAVLEISVDAIEVTHAAGSGCYGHNGADDVALDAALLARAVDRPVMCLWSRADELSWSPYGAAMRVTLSAGLSANGAITDWRAEVQSPPHVARPGFSGNVNFLAARQLGEKFPEGPSDDVPMPQGGGMRNSIPLYRVGRRHIVHHLLPQGPLRSSALRSLGAHGNVFAIESFMDELAALAGADPVAFRLRNCDDPRAARVIETAADAVGWRPDDPGGEGKGRGIGFARYKGIGAYYAVVAEVEVTDRVRLIRCTGAVDAGAVVHRDGLLNQIEGGVVQAASWTLKEQVGWTDTGFSVRSWTDYPILSFSEAPDIRTLIVGEDNPSVGAGECAAGPVAAAIANAVAHALGVRVRDMPLTPERIASIIQAT